MLHNEVLMDIRAFILGGNAEFTILQESDGKSNSARYKVKSNEEGTVFFVYADSEESKDMVYQGYIKKSDLNTFIKGKKGTPNERSVKALMWVLRHCDNMDDRVHVLHHGKCSVCGRKLKDVKSLVYGIGPVCINKVQIGGF